MAKARVSYSWGEGDDRQSVDVEVSATSSYPDALNQVRVEAGRVFAEALLNVVNLEREDDGQHD